MEGQKEIDKQIIDDETRVSKIEKGRLNAIRSILNMIDAILSQKSPFPIKEGGSNHVVHELLGLSITSSL